MSQPAFAPDETLARARGVLRQESEAIQRLAAGIGQSFLDAVALLLDCRGMVVVTGMGKAGLIGAKISATFASTGSRSHFVHPAEAVHGDLGRIFHEDVVLALSRSGTTEEVLRLLEPLKRTGTRLIAVTSNSVSPLAKHSNISIDIGAVVEACPLGLAPTTSTSVMLALGDALAMTVMELRKFSKEEFARFHPAGALGRKLLTVREVMRRGQQNPIIRSSASLTEALQAMTDTRVGAVCVVDEKGAAIGFFTDGDLRRLLLNADASLALDSTIATVMTHDPITIGPSQLASEAVHLMKTRRLDQILVVDEQKHPLGMLDVQDLIEVGLV